MNRRKQAENIRKRNAELNQQLDELRQRLKDKPQTDKLIFELEQIKDEWLNALQDLNDKREKYDSLISDMMEIKKIMKATGYKIKIPWYRKFKRK